MEWRIGTAIELAVITVCVVAIGVALAVWTDTARATAWMDGDA